MLALLALIAAAQAPSTAGTDTVRARVAAQPRIVETFISRRAMCNHFAGEDAYDAERGREIGRAMRNLRCATVERDEAALRRCFRGRADTLAVLDETRDWLGW